MCKPFPPRRLGALLALGLLILPLAALHASTGSYLAAPHPAAVTLVARPWAEVTINGGQPFVIPSTVLLEPGEYTLSIRRRGYQSVETTIRVEGRAPQHHFFRLERR